MYGWVHEGLHQITLRKYGEDTWKKILRLANIEFGGNGEVEIDHYYTDQETFDLVNAMGSIIGVVSTAWTRAEIGWIENIPRREVYNVENSLSENPTSWRSQPFHKFTMETGWDELLRALAPDLESFLNNLDALHYFVDHVVYKTKLKGPSFRCEAKDDNSLLLHYYSSRSGIYPIVKGQMILLEDFDSEEDGKSSKTLASEHSAQRIIYVCSPNVTTVDEMVVSDLYLADIPVHDTTRDLILLNQTRISQVELNKRLEETMKQLQNLTSELDSAKQKSDELLAELLPPSVAQALRNGQAVEAREFSSLTVLFTDIVGFTTICSKCKPFDVVHLLNEMYSRFDRLTELNGVYKVETIGDAYMVVGGCPEEAANHAERVLNMSIGMLMESATVVSPVANRRIQIRGGIHSGPAVAGVVGKKMPRYCLFGETINMASRMESHSVPTRIHLTKDTYDIASKSDTFAFTERGWVKVNGQSNFTYFLVKNTKKTLWELIDRERGENWTSDGYEDLAALLTGETTLNNLNSRPKLSTANTMLDPNYEIKESVGFDERNSLDDNSNNAGLKEEQSIFSSESGQNEQTNRSTVCTIL